MLGHNQWGYNKFVNGVEAVSSISNSLNSNALLQDISEDGNYLVSCHSSASCKFFIWNAAQNAYNLAQGNAFISGFTNSHVSGITDMKMSPDGQYVCVAIVQTSKDTFIFRKNKNNNGFTDLRVA